MLSLLPQGAEERPTSNRAGERKNDARHDTLPQIAQERLAAAGVIRPISSPKIKSTLGDYMSLASGSTMTSQYSFADASPLDVAPTFTAARPLWSNPDTHYELPARRGRNLIIVGGGNASRKPRPCPPGCVLPGTEGRKFKSPSNANVMRAVLEPLPAPTSPAVGSTANALGLSPIAPITPRELSHHERLDLEGRPNPRRFHVPPLHLKSPKVIREEMDAARAAKLSSEKEDIKSPAASLIDGEIVSRALKELRWGRNIWNASLWLMARMEATRSGQKASGTQTALLQCVKENTDQVIKQGYYDVNAQGRRVHLDMSIVVANRTTWFGRENVQFNPKHMEEFARVDRGIPPPAIICDSNPLDVVVSLRRGMAVTQPLVLVVESLDFDKHGGIDLERLVATNPHCFAVRSDFARFAEAARVQLRDGSVTLKQHLCAQDDPYVFICYDVTLFRGSREEGFPLLEEPIKVHVIVTGMVDARPGVQFVRGEDVRQEWYQNEVDHTALLDRLNLIGLTALETATEQHPHPILIMGSFPRHPREAVANSLKQWRRCFASRFHSVFFCTGRDGAKETKNALLIDQIVNKQVYDAVENQKLLHKFKAWHWNASVIRMSANAKKLDTVSHKVSHKKGRGSPKPVEMSAAARRASMNKSDYSHRTSERERRSIVDMMTHMMRNSIMSEKGGIFSESDDSEESDEDDDDDEELPEDEPETHVYTQQAPLGLGKSKQALVDGDYHIDEVQPTGPQESHLFKVDGAAVLNVMNHLHKHHHHHHHHHEPDNRVSANEESPKSSQSSHRGHKHRHHGDRHSDSDSDHRSPSNHGHHKHGHQSHDHQSPHHDGHVVHRGLRKSRTEELSGSSSTADEHHATGEKHQTGDARKSLSRAHTIQIPEQKDHDAHAAFGPSPEPVAVEVLSAAGSDERKSTKESEHESASHLKPPSEAGNSKHKTHGRRISVCPDAIKRKSRDVHDVMGLVGSRKQSIDVGALAIMMKTQALSTGAKAGEEHTPLGSRLGSRRPTETQDHLLQVRQAMRDELRSKVTHKAPEPTNPMKERRQSRILSHLDHLQFLSNHSQHSSHDGSIIEEPEDSHTETKTAEITVKDGANDLKFSKLPEMKRNSIKEDEEETEEVQSDFGEDDRQDTSKSLPDLRPLVLAEKKGENRRSSRRQSGESVTSTRSDMSETGRRGSLKHKKSVKGCTWGDSTVVQIGDKDSNRRPKWMTKFQAQPSPGTGKVSQASKMRPSLGSGLVAEPSAASRNSVAANPNPEKDGESPRRASADGSRGSTTMRKSLPGCLDAQPASTTRKSTTDATRQLQPVVLGSRSSLKANCSPRNAEKAAAEYAEKTFGEAEMLHIDALAAKLEERIQIKKDPKIASMQKEKARKASLERIQFERKELASDAAKALAKADGLATSTSSSTTATGGEESVASTSVPTTRSDNATESPASTQADAEALNNEAMQTLSKSESCPVFPHHECATVMEDEEIPQADGEGAELHQRSSVKKLSLFESQMRKKHQKKAGKFNSGKHSDGAEGTCRRFSNIEALGERVWDF